MKNTAGDNILVGKVNVHSTIDLITNSSTEIFCVVDGNSAETIQDVVDGVLEDLGCRCLLDDPEDGLRVEPYEKWNDEKMEEEIVEGQFVIWASYHAPPCKAIMKRLDELLTIVERFDD